jgi:hypothetical protein
MDALTLASLLTGITGYSLRDVLQGLSRRHAPRKAIASASARLLSIAAAEDDPLCGRWRIAAWRYQWRAGPSASWQNAPYHVDGDFYVLFKHKGEPKWKATLLLNYAWQSGRQRWLPLRLQKAIDRRRGRVFTVVYDVVLVQLGPGAFAGTADMTYRSPDINRSFSGRFPELRLTADDNLEGNYHNTDPQPEPMKEARADVRFHHRCRWELIDVD